MFKMIYLSPEMLKKDEHKAYFRLRYVPMLKKALCMILLGISLCSNAQTKVYGRNDLFWLMYLGDHPMGKKLGVHLEAQGRWADFGRDWQQILFRPGVNYYFNSQLFATLGYCYLQTWPYGPFPAKSAYPEHRFWEQLQGRKQVKSFEFLGRLRLEQRFQKLPVAVPGEEYAPGPAAYSNRIRYLQRISFGLNGKSITDKSFYFTAYDEIFFQSGVNVNKQYFDQNRLYAGLGYRIPKIGRLELAYMHQHLRRTDRIRIENNHILVLCLTSTNPFGLKK